MGSHRPAPPDPDCRVCGGDGEDAYGQRCVCTYNKDRAHPVAGDAAEQLRAASLRFWAEDVLAYAQSRAHQVERALEADHGYAASVAVVATTLTMLGYALGVAVADAAAMGGGELGAGLAMAGRGVAESAHIHAERLRNAPSKAEGR